MLRLMNSFKELKLEVTQIAVNSVRWRRKPRKPMWKGTAKSKIFRVPPRPIIPKEEALEIQRLSNKYKTEVKTINRYLTLKYNVQNQQQEDQDVKRKEFEADLKACMELNDEWNAHQKVIREARLAKELEEAIQLATQRKLETDKRREQQRKEFEEIVKREKECSKDFILPEMLDAAIEIALANPIDHNFALDLEGNKIVGRMTAPDTVDNKASSVKQ